MDVRATRFAHFGRPAFGGCVAAPAGLCRTSVFSLSRACWLRGVGRLLRLGLVGVGSLLGALRLFGVPMFSSFSRVGFCGSRSLPASALPLVSSVVSAVLSGSSARLAVGCSVGADSLVLASVPFPSFPRVSVFAAFGSGGRGACSLSAVPSVLASARAGASVVWWAGGKLSVPLRLRLAGRSVALVRFLAGARPSALVCFLSSRKSRGSLLACRLAARLGVSVFVFCVGFSPVRLPRLGSGFWSPVQVAGSAAFQWQSRPLTKKLREIYRSATCIEYNRNLRKMVRQLRPEVEDLLTWIMVVLAVIVCTVAYIVNPNPTPKTPTSLHPIQIEEQYTGYDEIQLPFYDETEAQACLNWLNKTPESRLRKLLAKAKITAPRVDVLLTNRPHKSWLNVYFLPKGMAPRSHKTGAERSRSIGIRTIEQIISAWRNSQFD